MSWIEPRAAGGHALRVAKLVGQTWSAPVVAAEGDSFFVNWADRPSVLALGGGRLAAHWLRRFGPETYSYEIRIAFSGDSGRTWSRPLCPHRDATATEHVQNLKRRLHDRAPKTVNNVLTVLNVLRRRRWSGT